MNRMNATRTAVVACALLLVGSVWAQNWPQWLGPDRNGHATDFKPPKAWPKELTKKWSVTVGSGVATPALVGDRLYVFTRADGDEVLRCLKADSGEKVWEEKYSAKAPTRPGSGFNNEFVGPRASPVVADGKVVVLSADGALSCYDAGNGKKLWRKDEISGVPRFFTSSSPLVVDGLVIAQLGGRNGAVVAYELASGKEKWKAADEPPAYASPVLMQLGGDKVIVAETESRIVGLAVADGKILWETSFAVQGRGYNASTPLVDGQTLIYSGSSRGTRAVKLEKKDGKVSAVELWKNDNSVQFNTPVLAGGMVFGITGSNSLFCINAKDGKTAWTASLAGSATGGGGRGRRGGGGGYGSIVAAGAYLFALTPRGELVVFERSDKEFKKVAGYKVADRDAYAYPIVSGSRIFTKDRDGLTLWTLQ